MRKSTLFAAVIVSAFSAGCSVGEQIPEDEAALKTGAGQEPSQTTTTTTTGGGKGGGTCTSAHCEPDMSEPVDMGEPDMACVCEVKVMCTNLTTWSTGPLGVPIPPVPYLHCNIEYKGKDCQWHRVEVWQDANACTGSHILWDNWSPGSAHHGDNSLSHYVPVNLGGQDPCDVVAGILKSAAGNKYAADRYWFVPLPYAGGNCNSFVANTLRDAGASANLPAAAYGRNADGSLMSVHVGGANAAIDCSVADIAHASIGLHEVSAEVLGTGASIRITNPNAEVCVAGLPIAGIGLESGLQVLGTGVTPGGISIFGFTIIPF